MMVVFKRYKVLFFLALVFTPIAEAKKPKNINLPPVADAGVTQTIFAGEDIPLDGSMSYDPEATALSYEWDIVAKPSLQAVANFIGANQPHVNLQVSEPGLYIVSLHVKDETYTSKPAYVALNVLATNGPLVFGPASFQGSSTCLERLSKNYTKPSVEFLRTLGCETVEASFSVGNTNADYTLIAQNSGLAAAYVFINGKTVLAELNLNPAQPTIIRSLGRLPANNLLEGNFWSSVLPAPHSGSITIAIRANLFLESDNTPPIAQPLNLVTGYQLPVMQALEANDPNPNSSLSYEIFDEASNGTASVNNQGEVLYTPNLNFVGKDEFWVLVKDSGVPQMASLARVSVQVTNNLAPQPQPPNIVSNGEIVNLQLTANDPNPEQTHTYTLLSQPSFGATTLTSTGLLSFDPQQASGSGVIQYKVTDNGLPNLSATVNANVFILPNTVPNPSSPSILVGIGATRVQTIAKGDPDPNQIHTYEIIQAPAAGLAAISAGGELTYIAPQSPTTTSIVIRVTDNANPPASGTVTIPVSVVSNFPPSSGQIFAQILSQDIPVTVRLVPQNFSDPDGSIVEYLWTLDGISQRGNLATNPQGVTNFDFVSFGTRTVSLQVRDNLGATTTVNATIHVANTAVPSAVFQPSVISGPTPLLVNFTSSAQDPDGSISQYRWLFGDNSAEQVGAGLSSVSKTYNTPGSYLVRFRTRDNNSTPAEGESFIRVYAGVSPPAQGTAPNADFTVLPRQQSNGVALNFDANRSFAAGNGVSISQYNWNFNDATPDGGLASGSQVAYTYVAQNINLFPRLTLTTSSGATSSILKEIFLVNTGHAPRARIRTLSAQSGVAPLTISAQGSCFDYDGTIASEHWDFQDGSAVKNGANVTHTYQNAGVYTMRHWAVDNDGNQHQQFTTITVSPANRIQLRRNEADVGDGANQEQKDLLTGACATGDAYSCHMLGNLYTLEGDAFVAGQFYARACTLGYTPACSLQAPMNLTQIKNLYVRKK